MKYYKLDKEEKEILDAFEKAGFPRALPKKEKEKKIAEYKKIARASLRRTRNINIRISEQDLQKIKTKAAEKGIPYQTLVTSVLHQYRG